MADLISPDALQAGANVSAIAVGVVIFLIGAVLVFGFFHFAGLFHKRPYTVNIIKNRAGSHPMGHAKGRYKKNGKFEIYYGLFNAIEVEAPPESLIQAENQLYCFSEGGGYFWTTVTVNTAAINAEPTLSEASKVALVNQVMKGDERFTAITFMTKYGMHVMIIVCMFILCMSFIVASKFYSDSNEAYAAAINAHTSTLENLMKNSTIVIYKEYPTTNGLPSGINIAPAG